MSRPSYPFTVRSADVWKIALPASLAFITEPLAGLVDITVIGRLGDAGLLGGLALGALAFDAIFSLAYFLRLGTAGLTAQAVGARDPLDGLMHVVRALLVALVIGVAMIVLTIPLHSLAAAIWAPPPGAAAAFATYFGIRIWSAPFSLINYALLGWFYGRASATIGMVLQMLMNVINIVLSIYFVYGLGWGVEGAALGTVAGHVVTAMLGLIFLARHYGGLLSLLARIDRAHLVEASALTRMFSLSADLMIRSMALMAAYGYFAAQGSRAGEVVLSANAILLNFLMLSGFFLDGLAQAAEQLSGKAVGANHKPAFDAAYRLSMYWGVAMALALSVIWLVGGHYAIDFMTTSPEVREMARQFLWLAALTAITGMPAFVFDGVLVGATLNATMRNGMVASLALFLVLSYALQPMGNTGLWIGLHIFFVARAGYYWLALERRRAGLFAA